MKPIHLSILGSTGSIGKNTLEIVSSFPERFVVDTISAKRHSKTLMNQIIKFRPEMVSVFEEDTARIIERELPCNVETKVVYGVDGYNAVATYPTADTVVSAMVGSAGLIPIWNAICAGKNIALANKETLVMAGDLIMKAVREKGVSLLPIDSEHSAIFQCLVQNSRKELSKIYLTASGGPFWQKDVKLFSSITVEEALLHPNWNMGPKITIDSATMMNKGLEVIEAIHLFGVTADQIEVVIHPQSMVHSMVKYQDGSVMAQLSKPDMRGAIAYALSYPDRLPLDLPEIDFNGLKLDFCSPNMEKCRCLELAMDAIRTGGTMPCVLNAANEVAVALFIEKKIGFLDIPKLIEDVMNRHVAIKNPSLEDIITADTHAKKEAQELSASFRI